jgi:hypothetical protein
MGSSQFDHHCEQQSRKTNDVDDDVDNPHVDNVTCK